MMRMLGQGVALTMVLSALVACGGSPPTGPTSGATVVEPAVAVIGASTSDVELDGTVVANGNEWTSATQLVSSS
jgi:hypothetical protein